MEKGGQISGGGGAGGGWDSIYENDQSGKVNNIELGIDLFRYSNDITGAEWDDITAIRSPCPTLDVIGAISKQMIEKEELKRMVERPGLNVDGTPIRLTKRKRVKRVAQKVVGGVLSRTVGKVAGFASKRLLGKVSETALIAVFFYNEYTPDVIGCLWRPDAFKGQSFSAMFSEHKRPIDNRWEEDRLVITNASDVMRVIQFIIQDVTVDIKILDDKLLKVTQMNRNQVQHENVKPKKIVTKKNHRLMMRSREHNL